MRTTLSVMMMVLTVTSLLHTLLKRRVGFLRDRETSRLQGGSQSTKRLGKRAAALLRTRDILTQRAEIRLGLSKVPRLKVLPELLKLALDFLRSCLPCLQVLTQGVDG